MAEHFMSNVLRWLADGIVVQMYEQAHHPADDPLHQRERWVDCTPEAVMRSIIERKRPREHYRAKPPTFMLNGVEIGLPMTPEQAAAHEGLAFIPSLAGEQDYISVADKKSEMFKKAVRYRMLFAKPEDAAFAGRALIQVMAAAVPIAK